MRIRSIRPEFWTSEDIAALDIPTRLLFIGLWSYVDDNGVGRDVEKLIAAELFPLEDDPRDTLAMVSRGLQQLSTGGQISRYTVDSKPFFHVTAWNVHQKIDRPGKERYPLPTRQDAAIRVVVDEPSRQSRDTLDAGEGEKGRRGEGKRVREASRFSEFWAAFPLKKGKQAAERNYNAAVRRGASEQRMIDGALAYAKSVDGVDPSKTKYPQGWITDGRYEDELEPALIATSTAPFTPPLPPGDMPDDLYRAWNVAHAAAYRENRPGPTDWRQLREAS